MFLYSNVYIFVCLCQVTCHLVILVVLGVTAWVLWLLLKLSSEGGNTLWVSLLVTLLMHLGPLLFTWLVRFEDYSSPRTTLYVSLARTFLLEIVVIGVLLVFWLKNSTEQVSIPCVLHPAPSSELAKLTRAQCINKSE